MGDIGQFMQSPVFSIGSECTLSEAILFFHTQQVDALFVEEGGRYVGIAIKSKVIQKIGGGLSPETGFIRESMEQPIPCLDHHSSVQEASEFMESNRIQFTAVTENQLVIGMLSQKDLTSGINNPGQ
jgi:signal-transduction protein with cAMP-binding, CBS, and nucleotidyltransferase domain